VPITGECVVVVLLELDLEDGVLDRALFATGVGGADDAASIQTCMVYSLSVSVSLSTLRLCTTVELATGWLTVTL